MIPEIKPEASSDRYIDAPIRYLLNPMR